MPGAQPMLLNVTPLYLTLLHPTISGLSDSGSVEQLGLSETTRKRRAIADVLIEFVFTFNLLFSFVENSGTVIVYFICRLLIDSIRSSQIHSRSYEPQDAVRIE